MTELQKATQVFLDNWFSTEPRVRGVSTGVYIENMRKALEDEQAVEPVAWVLESELTELLFCNGMSIFADSPKIWFDEVPEHLVPPPAARRPVNKRWKQ